MYSTCPGFNDGYGAVTPIRYKIPTGLPYYDINFTGTVNNIISTTSLLGPLLSPTGILASFPQISTPVYSGSSIDFYCKIHVKAILISIAFHGAEGTALLAADIYNEVRTALWTTGVVYSISPVEALETDVHQWPNTVDMQDMLLDLKFDLPSISFEPSTRYNAPSLRTYRMLVPVNRTFDCVTQSNTGTTGWDTKDGNILFSAVTDSTASPHPIMYSNSRVFYEIIRR